MGKFREKILPWILFAIFVVPYLVCMAIFLAWMPILHVQTERNFKKYHDIELYTQHKYRDKEMLGEKVSSSGWYAENFFPKYEEIEYNYSDIDFYIFDGTCTMSRTAVTFVLDLKFDDKDEYEAAKQSELSTHTFRTEYAEKRWNEFPVFEFDIHNYSCKTVESKGYPRGFELICLNDSSYVLRYLTFEEWESPEYVKNAGDILNCTNCPWKN